MLSTPPSNKEQQHLYFNLFKNPGFETNIQGLSKGLVGDGATTTPVGTAFGQPVYPEGPASDQSVVLTQLSRDTVSPLTGVASLKISKPATDQQNDILYLEEIRLPDSRIGQPLQFSCKYKYSANFQITSGVSDIRIFFLAYDTLGVDNIVLSTPFCDVDGSGTFKTSLQTSKRYIRPFFYVATTNASAYDFWADDLMLTDLPEIFLANVSDWESYNPDPAINQGFGTISVANSKLEWKQDGDDILIRGYFQVGNNAASEARVALPHGLIVKSEGTSTVGEYFRGGNVPDNGGPIIVTNGQNYFKFANTYVFGGGVNVSAIVPVNGNAVAASSEYIYIPKIRIPIQGLTSGNKTRAQILQNVPVEAIYTTTTGSTVPNNSTLTIVNFDTKQYDLTGSVTTGAAWKFTAPAPAFYKVNAMILFQSTSYAAGNFVALAVHKNGSGTGTLLNVLRITGSLTDTVAISGSTDIWLNAGEYIDVRANTNRSGGSVTTTTSSWVNVSKKNDPNSILAFNRSTTKYLASNLTASATDIASLRFTNLIVGKRYEVTITNYSAIQSTNSYSVLQAFHNGSLVADNTIELPTNGAVFHNSTKSPSFFATATTVTVNWTKGAGNATLYGDGTRGRTYVTLKELNNEFEGGF